MTEQLKTAIVEKLRRVLRHITCCEWWLVQPPERDPLVVAAKSIDERIKDVELEWRGMKDSWL